MNNDWEFLYDPVTTLSSGFIDPLGNLAVLHFNVAGELEYQIDRRGWRVDFGYDDAHRLTKETWQPNISEGGTLSDPRVADYDYNGAGKLTSAVDPDSSLTFDYWNTGRVKRVDNFGTPGAPNVVITYGYPGPCAPDGICTGYDGNGNVTHVMDSLGGITEYTYDPLDRLQSVSQSGTGINEKRVDYAYDNSNALQMLRRYADVAGTLGVANTAYEYDCSACPWGLMGIHHRKASDSGVIHDLDYGRDALGNVLDLTDAEGPHTYTYDGLRRLRTADHPSGSMQPDEFYTYDAVGNRLSSHLSTTSTHSYQLGFGGSQLRQDDHYDYEYDAIGSLSRKTDRATGDYEVLVYDHRNRMTELRDYDSSGALAAEFTYAYDAANRRIRIDEAGVTFQFLSRGAPKPARPRRLKTSQ